MQTYVKFVKAWKLLKKDVFLDMPPRTFHSEARKAWVLSAARAAVLATHDYKESEMKRRRFAQ